MKSRRIWLATLAFLLGFGTVSALATPTVTVTYTTANNSVNSYNKDVTLTATLTGAHSLGNIVFTDNGLEFAEVTVTAAQTSAQYTITNLYQGSHNFAATFTGSTGTATGTKNTTIGSAYLPVPISKAYVAAWVNESGTSGESAATIETNTENLESEIATAAGLSTYSLPQHLHYFAWTDAWSSGTKLAQITNDIAHNRIPIISWQCGDTNKNVAAGNDDSTIQGIADGLVTLAQTTDPNYPIIIRWSWEMDNMANATTEETCMQSSGPPYSDSVSTQASNYVKAFQYIVAKINYVFAHPPSGSVVRPNIIWEFNPGYWAGSCLSSGTSPCSFTDSGNNTYTFTNDDGSTGIDPVGTLFYPGDSYADWIGIDTYNYSTTTYDFADLPGLGSNVASGLGFYPTYANTTSALVANPPVNSPGYDKPLSITETGVDKKTTGTDYQSTFLGGVESNLQSNYQQIKTFSYFDAPGNSPGESWVLDTNGGRTAFATLATTTPNNYACTYSSGTLTCM